MKPLDSAPGSPVAVQEVLELVDVVLRAAGDLTRLGDRLSGLHGQTAARSLVLGALARTPASIAEIARRRGLARQSVQETMRRLEAECLVSRVADSSRRSPKFALTELGRDVQQSLHREYWEWADDTAPALDHDALVATVSTLRALTAPDNVPAQVDPAGRQITRSNP